MKCAKMRVFFLKKNKIHFILFEVAWKWRRSFKVYENSRYMFHWAWKTFIG